MEYIITSEKHYHQTMIMIYDLMNRGEANLKPEDVEKLAAMTSFFKQVATTSTTVELIKNSKNLINPVSSAMGKSHNLTMPGLTFF